MPSVFIFRRPLILGSIFRSMATRRSSRLSTVTAPKGLSTVPTPSTLGVQTTANGSKKRKSAAKGEDIAVPRVEDAIPSTPKRKRMDTKQLSSSPEAPTPGVTKLLSMYHEPSKTNDVIRPPVVDRLAIPNGTNAQLVSPETRRLVSTRPLDQVSPSKKPSGTTTTRKILDLALEHLIKTEPKLKPVIEKHPCGVFSEEGLAEVVDPFSSLVSGIISQQVSGAAAKSIKAKFIALFNEGEDASSHSFPTPSTVCSTPIEILRSAGLSQRKAEYVKGLAQKFHDEELSTDMLFSASYEEVLEALIKVRGLGKWSVEMFACFGLKRMDVFSTGDLGVQRGMAALAGRDVAKLKGKGGKWKYMTEKEMEETAEKFKPYRSVFMWYCWRVEDVDISAFE